MPRIVVVGGGISGLAAAYRVTELDPSSEVVLFEATDRAGGLLRTEHVDDLVIDRGPDSILTEKPAAVELARRVGLADEIISTNETHRGAYVLCRGRLERIPEGFAVVGAARFVPLLRSPILSWHGKLRAMAEPFIPAIDAPTDESLQRFVERRFGREVLDRLAQPIAGGIYGGAADRLSATATLPKYVALEQRWGSVSRGLRKRASADNKQAASAARYGMFVSFKGGMQVLPDTVARRLGNRVRLNSAVEAIERGADGWRVKLQSGEAHSCDRVILALPAFHTARLVRPVDSALADSLSAIDYGSAAIATFVWARAEVPHPLDAFGFVVPEVEGRPIIASTWSSVKWAGRAPEDKVIIRVFFGGSGDTQELIATARKELRELIGVTIEPKLTRVDSWQRAMPLYHVGHLDQVRSIEAALEQHKGLEVAGNAYWGVGIPDSVRSGERAAERVIRQ